jgi:hypothetical protein
MASSEQRAYVYLQLPQSLEVVTAGFYKLDFPQGTPGHSHRRTSLCLASCMTLDIQVGHTMALQRGTPWLKPKTPSRSASAPRRGSAT